MPTSTRQGTKLKIQFAGDVHPKMQRIYDVPFNKSIAFDKQNKTGGRGKPPLQILTARLVINLKVKFCRHTTLPQEVKK